MWYYFTCNLYNSTSLFSFSNMRWYYGEPFETSWPGNGSAILLGSSEETSGALLGNSSASPGREGSIS